MLKYLILFCSIQASAALQATVIFNGKVTNRFLDKNYVSVIDQHQQEFKMPKKYLTHLKSISPGVAFNIELKRSTLRKLPRLKPGR